MALEKNALQRILIVGSGITGRGLGAMFADGGFSVTIWNPRRASQANIPAGCVFSQSLPAEVPDLVIECVPEVLETKVAVFAKLEAVYGAAPILASNTSGLPLEDIARPLTSPERFLGVHVFTPAEISPLVEVIALPATRPGLVDAVVEAIARCGKRSLRVSQPVVGHLLNRLQHALLHEAYHLVAHGIATPADIDAICKELLGPRLCVTGLIESKDRGGLEIHADAQDAIVPHLCKSKIAHGFLRRMVEDGRTGVRSGRGFYDWRGQDPDQLARVAGDRLRRLNAFLANEIGGEKPKPLPLPLSEEDD
jgi:3-hydroxybutyryl-CoA dehydrogenase